MVHDMHIVERFYASYSNKVKKARQRMGRPMTFAEKLMYAHSVTDVPSGGFQRGVAYAMFRPDRVAMQDATAQMALLQFMNAGRSEVAVPSTVHCDHLICAQGGANEDLPRANANNAEVYEFLRSASAHYGIGFWEPGAGIIHQVLLENYAFPGGMMIGTDSHTPNAGGMSMMAVGVGGADAVDVMAGLDWELKVPRIIGVRLAGRLSGWAAPKDVILELAGRLTVKGGTNAIIEYFGPGVAAISCTGRATICNMGAEVGATTSVFPYDANVRRYLVATGRKVVADLADACGGDLRADDDVYLAPECYYDEVIDIDLSRLSPRINGPFTPDAACTVAEMPMRAQRENFPERVDVVLIGSCTNSSYQDISRAAEILRAGMAAGLQVRTGLILNPGSEFIRVTAERDGLLDVFRRAGAVVMANACGPCIGQWKRKSSGDNHRNTIITTFNRNFAKRADGNPNTFAFITSVESAVGYAFSGTLAKHPSTDGRWRSLLPAEDASLPKDGFAETSSGYIAPQVGSSEPVIRDGSVRLQRLRPFSPWNGEDFSGLKLLIKVRGKCTTDHISMAGPWLKYRGHLENISQNLLMGAVNAFNGKTNEVKDELNGSIGTVATVAADYRDHASGSIIVAEDNYGEGSSREHAAMEPRFMGVKVVLAKSFARIHETNLKKQGMLALTFARATDYDLIREGDVVTVHCAGLLPGSIVRIDLAHTDGSVDTIEALHTYNAQQLEWFRAGSALNSLRGRLLQEHSDRS